MVDFATASEVADRWRPLTAAEQTVAEALCADATALIRARFPGIDGQVEAGTVDAAVVRLVAANMVKRAMIAPPDGLASQSSSMGPYSVSQSYANPLGNVFFTEAEKTMILGYQPRAVSMQYANTTSTAAEGSYGGYVYGYGW